MTRWTGLPLPFHNIKSRGNHAFLNVVDLFYKLLLCPLHVFPVTFPVSTKFFISHLFCARTTPSEGTYLHWVGFQYTTIISWVRREKVWSPGFNVKTTVLSGATCLVSNGNDISSRASPTMKARQTLKRDKRLRPVLVCYFAHFAAYDVKGRQVTTGYRGSCPW